MVAGGSGHQYLGVGEGGLGNKVRLLTLWVLEWVDTWVLRDEGKWGVSGGGD